MPINPKFQHPDGKFKKGTCSNPSGRPARGPMLKLLKEMFGEDGRELLYVLVAQIYGEDIENVGVDKKLLEILPKINKKRKKKAKNINSRLQSENIKFLWDQLFGKALQETKTELLTEKDINVTIGTKKDKLDPKDF